MNLEGPKEVLPRLSLLLRVITRPLNRVFDWLYNSKYNPLYRSGTLATGLLAVLLATGLYLLLFYSVSQPYQSLREIHEQQWLGVWIRSVHRYATDLALIAILFHILQLVVQGKTWGPRLLAWVSGVVLLQLFMISAWSGYVMIWDQHGQLLAQSGATILQSLPFLRDALGQAFDGSAPLNQSFFFMNLFLHVAIPVGMIIGLWIHTAKISRTIWFPVRPIFLGTILALLFLAIVRPATLLPEGDLLAIIGETKVDILFGFWMPLVPISPLGVLLGFLSAFLLLALAPVLVSPPKEKKRGTSLVKDEDCTGCTQCARDCPYEAITMVPAPEGRRLLAKVNANNCVSCGICAASCADLAIGPPSRSGPEQLEHLRLWLEEHQDAGLAKKTVVISCIHNGSANSSWAANSEDAMLYPVDCCGSVHTRVMEGLLEICHSLLVHACPERNCFNRDALELSRQRIFMRRVPFLSRNIDRTRLNVVAASEAEIPLAAAELRQLRNCDSGDETRAAITFGTRLLAGVKVIVATLVLVAAIPPISEFSVGADPVHGLLRITAKLSGKSVQNCRALTAEEKAELPMHMQKPQICDESSQDYKLRINIGQRERLNKVFVHSGIRGDSPLQVSAELELEPGTHKLGVLLEPVSANETNAQRLLFSGDITIRAGQIMLIKPGPEKGSLTVSE